HHTEPWTHRAVFIETRSHDIHTELQRAWLVKNCWPHTGPASVIHVHPHTLIMCQLHDLLQLIRWHNLVRHRQAGQHHQPDARLPLQGSGKLLDTRRVDERGAGLGNNPDNGWMAIARRDTNDDITRLDERQMRGIRRTGEPVEKGDIVLLG